MAHPKRKKSKMKIRIRKAANAWKGLQSQTCPQCEAPYIPHRVCGDCGYYKGQQVVAKA